MCSGSHQQRTTPGVMRSYIDHRRYNHGVGDDESSYRYLGMMKAHIGTWVSSMQLIREVKRKKKNEKTNHSQVRGEGAKGLGKQPQCRSQSPRAHNMWAVSLPRYFMHASIGTRSEMRALDHRTRAILRQCGAHKAADSVQRLYLK